MPRELLLVGPPASPRVLAFAEAARKRGAQVEVRSYLEVLQTRVPPRPGTWVRLESPGGCAATTRAILKQGIAPLAAAGGTPLTARSIDALPCERGEMAPSRQWYFGWRALLEELADWQAAGIRWTSSPEAIATAFDKRDCLDRWTAAGLPIPGQYRGVSNYAELRSRIQKSHARVFVKLRYGYSAMGAVALEWRDDRVRALTTVEAVSGDPTARLFVTKRPRQLLIEKDIAELIDRLGRECLVVEEWLPKARWRGLSFDLRVVMVGGQMRQVVGRAHRSPFTNLNLDARRVPREIVKTRLGERWEELRRLGNQAVAALPAAALYGIDVLVAPRGARFALLEANAFGDYLPGLMHRGESTYEATLKTIWPAAAESFR